MLAGGHLPSITKTIFANDDIRKLLLKKFLEAINQECNALCRKSSGTVSPFRSIPVDKLAEFSWVTDLQSRAPTLSQIFSVVVSHSDHQNE